MADKLRKFKSIGEEDRTNQRRREKNDARREANFSADRVSREQMFEMIKFGVTINR